MVVIYVWWLYVVVWCVVLGFYFGIVLMNLDIGYFLIYVLVVYILIFFEFWVCIVVWICVFELMFVVWCVFVYLGVVFFVVVGWYGSDVCCDYCVVEGNVVCVRGDLDVVV